MHKQEKHVESDYVLKLFVTGMSLVSIRAIENITMICKNHLNNNYSLEIIDIHKHPELVQEYDIIASPTLLKKSPVPCKKLIGDLSDKEKVLTGLGIITH